MGKRLVIKGADFSENGIYVPNEKELNSDLCTIANSGINYTNGELVTGDTYHVWYASDFVEIEDSSTLTIIQAPNANSFGLAFYSSNKTFISGIGYGEVYQTGGIFSIPANAEYIRYCHNSTGIQIQMILS